MLDAAPSTREIAERFMTTFGALQRHFAHALARDKASRVTDPQLRTLISMRFLGRKGLKQIAEHNRLSASALCTMLNRCVRDGLVRREEDTNDRRNTFYTLTKTGLAMVEEEMAWKRDRIVEELGVLGDAEQRGFLEAVETMRAAIESMEGRKHEIT